MQRKHTPNRMLFWFRARNTKSHPCSLCIIFLLPMNEGIRIRVCNRSELFTRLQILVDAPMYNGQWNFSGDPLHCGSARGFASRFRRERMDPARPCLFGREYNGVAPLWRSSSRPCSMRLGMLASSSHPCVAQTWPKWEYLPPARRSPPTLLSYPVQCRLTALFLSMVLGAEYTGSSSPSADDPV